MDCKKFIYFGYESENECLIANQGILTTTMGWQTQFEEVQTNKTALEIIGIIALAIIIILSVSFGIKNLVQFLLIRTIVRLYNNLHRTREYPSYKPSLRARLRNLMKKLELNKTDLERNLSRIKKLFTKIDTESDLEAGKNNDKVSYNNYIIISKFFEYNFIFLNKYFRPKTPKSWKPHFTRQPQTNELRKFGQKWRKLIYTKPQLKSLWR